MRGKHLDILGYTNFAAPPDVRTDAYLTMVELAMAGELAVDVHRVPLEQVMDAWAGLVQGSAKYVLVP